MRATLQPFGAGVYTVKYQSLSADDDDYHDGTYEFTVLNPDGSEPGGASDRAKTPPGDDDGGSITTIVAVVVAALAIGGALVFAFRYKRNPA
jgi:hypothetical protein